MKLGPLYQKVILLFNLVSFWLNLTKKSLGFTVKDDSFKLGWTYNLSEASWIFREYCKNIKKIRNIDGMGANTVLSVLHDLGLGTKADFIPKIK